MLRGAAGVAAGFTLSRTAGSQVAAIDDDFRATLAATVPVSRSIQTDCSPSAKFLSSQINDPGFMVTCPAHRSLTCKQVVADDDFLYSTVTTTVPFLVCDVRKHNVVSETLSCDVLEFVRSRHEIDSCESMLD